MQRFFLLFLILFPHVLFAHSDEIIRYNFSQSGYVDLCAPGSCPDECFFFDSVVGTTYTGDCAGTSMTVNGVPVRVNDYTYPAGFAAIRGYAYDFDGATTNLTCTDANCGGIGKFDPSGDFSVQCAGIFTSNAAYQGIFTKKLSTGNQRSWALYAHSNGTSSQFSVSDDGTSGNQTVLSGANVFLNGRPFFITCTYDYVTDGTSIMACYADNLATVSSNTAHGPPFNSTADVFLGGDTDNGFYPGLISDCNFWSGVVLTEAQHDYMYAQWQGRIASSGGQYATIASITPPYLILAPPASNENFLVLQPANATYIGSPSANIGGIPRFQGTSSTIPPNYAQRSLLSTCTQNGNTEPDGWTVVETAGSGASDLTCDTTHNAVLGGGAVKCVTTAADSSCVMYSACINITDTAYSKFTTWVYGGSGDDDFEINLRTWTDDACTAGESTKVVLADQDVPAAWTRYVGSVASASWGTVESIKFEIGFYTTATTAWIAVPVVTDQIGTSVSYEDAVCLNDADSTCSASSIRPGITTPWTANEQGKVTVINIPVEFSTTTVNYVLHIPGTSGNNNRMQITYNNSGYSFTQYDSGGTAKTVTQATVPVQYTEQKLELMRSGDGILWGEVNDVGPAAATGAIRNGINTTTYLANSSSYSNGWLHDLVFSRRLR